SFQGISVGNDTDQSGTLLLTGSGTTLRSVFDSTNPTYPAGYFAVGGASGASGQATITNGATLAFVGGGGVGTSLGGQGTVTVSAGGTWTAAQLGVGTGGTGTVTV